MTRSLRWLLGIVGVLLGLYGGWLLLRRGHDLLNVAEWLAGGVILHDAALAGLTLAIAAIGLRLAPAPARAPLTVGFIVLGSVTLLAIPVLGRFGARPDNSTLLDRDYTAGWLVLLALTSVSVIAATAVRSRRHDGVRRIHGANHARHRAGDD